MEITPYPQGLTLLTCGTGVACREAAYNYSTWKALHLVSIWGPSRITEEGMASWGSIGKITAFSETAGRLSHLDPAPLRLPLRIDGSLPLFRSLLVRNVGEDPV
jgi:hypothetical protein